MTDRSEASLPSAVKNPHPHVPPVPHATSTFTPTFAPPWQQHLPGYPPTYPPQHWQQGRPTRKLGLDTVIDAVCGPTRRPERHWVFVRTHVPQQKPQRYRASSEETIDIPRPFPLPKSGRAYDRKAFAPRWADTTPRKPPRRRLRSNTPPRKAHEYHVRDRRQRSSSLGGQFDGPASSDNNSKRDGSKTNWKDVTRTRVYMHYCAICGRTRSTTYHKEHPWGPGIKPKSGVCRRCTPPRPWQPEPSEPSELSVRPPFREEIISESESEEIILRHSAKTKQLKTTKSDQDHKSRSRRDSMSPARSSRAHAIRRPVSPESLTPFATSSDAGTEGQPRIIRRLVYRYVPDLERMESRKARNDKTEIIIEEQPAHAHTVGKPAQVLASRPGAWSRGRMVQVDEQWEEESVTSSGSEDEKTTSVEPPEWYFRRVTRRTAPVVLGGRDDRVRPSPINSRRFDRDLPDDGARPNRQPLRGILQASAPPRVRGRPYYEDDREDDEDPTYCNDQQSRVAFAPGTKKGRRGTGVPCTPAPARAREAWKLGQEALRDSVEAKVDDEEMNRVKSRARHEMAKDGGPYMELDGHYSDDQEHVKPINEDGVRPKEIPSKVSFIPASPPRLASQPIMPMPRSPPPPPRSVSHNANIRRQPPKFFCQSLLADDPVIYTGFPAKVRQAQTSIFSGRSKDNGDSSGDDNAQSDSSEPAQGNRRHSPGLATTQHQRQKSSPGSLENSPTTPLDEFSSSSTPRAASVPRPQLSGMRRFSISDSRQRSMSPARRHSLRRVYSSPRLGRLSYTPPGSPSPQLATENIFWGQTTAAEEKIEEGAVVVNVRGYSLKEPTSQGASSTVARTMEADVDEEMPVLP